MTTWLRTALCLTLMALLGLTSCSSKATKNAIPHTPLASKAKAHQAVRHSPHKPQPTPYSLDQYERDLYIDESETGKTFRYRETVRFGFFLDESQHPLKALDISDCDFIGYVSNWSQNGPDQYPIGFQSDGIGSCTVRNRDFWVQIIGRSNS